jgi:hypothetical protein
MMVGISIVCRSSRLDASPYLALPCICDAHMNSPLDNPQTDICTHSTFVEEEQSIGPACGGDRWGYQVAELQAPTLLLESHEDILCMHR